MTQEERQQAILAKALADTNASALAAHEAKEKPAIYALKHLFITTAIIDVRYQQLLKHVEHVNPRTLLAYTTFLQVSGDIGSDLVQAIILQEDLEAKAKNGVN